MSQGKVELGKLLFFDARLSGDASTSCASCHSPESGWGDGGDLSRGYPGTQHWRNSQTILNSAYYAKLFWAGEGSEPGSSSQERGLTGNVAGNGDTMMMEERLRQVPEYVKRFREVFGTAWPTIDDAWRAISAFERTLVSHAKDVPFDRYKKGDGKALSESAKQGLTLFLGKARCVQCHHGPTVLGRGLSQHWRSKKSRVRGRSPAADYPPFSARDSRSSGISVPEGRPRFRALTTRPSVTPTGAGSVPPASGS